ncbi:uncharacterized protein LOC135396965 [Ornithodoros turicata]|uniref:uncharacterized protein LOC135396965 n=1 Tax=Ornithodoros turicata TaxID=34597 RepID=UPI003138CF37
MDETDANVNVVPCANELAFSVLLDEVFRHASAIFSKNSSATDDILVLQTTFRSTFSRMATQCISTTLKNNAPGVLDKSSNKDLQNTVEQKLREVVLKRKNYPANIKNKVAFQLQQEREHHFAGDDAKTEVSRRIKPLTFTHTNDDVMTVSNGRSHKVHLRDVIQSISMSMEKLRAIRRQEEDIKEFMSINGGDVCHRKLLRKQINNDIVSNSPLQ